MTTEVHMTFRTLFDDCVEQIKKDGADAVVVYKINRQPRGNRIRLTPRGGPHGEIVQASDHMTMGAFKATEIVEWIERMVAKAEKR